MRVVVLDCSRVVDVDAAAARAIKNVFEAYEAAKVPLLLAAMSGPVRDTLEAYSVYERSGSGGAASALHSMRYLTVFAAVAAAIEYLQSLTG